MINADIPRAPSGRSTPELPPVIGVRIPGPWKEPARLSEALQDGYELEFGILKTPNGARFHVDPQPPDRDFPNVFRMACREPMDGNEQRQIDRYAVNICLSGDGGSFDAARAMASAASALLHAGGIGVFVDNGLVAHPSADWLEMVASDTDGIVPAFVSVVGNVNEVRSQGMHVLGLRDVVIRRDDESSFDRLVQFMHDFSCSGIALASGDIVVVGGRTFTVRRDTAPQLIGSGPAHNPYGRWLLDVTDD